MAGASFPEDTHEAAARVASRVRLDLETQASVRGGRAEVTPDEAPWVPTREGLLCPETLPSSGTRPRVVGLLDASRAFAIWDCEEWRGLWSPDTAEADSPR